MILIIFNFKSTFTCGFTVTDWYSADVSVDICLTVVFSAVQAVAHAHLSSVGEVQSML